MLAEGVMSAPYGALSIVVLLCLVGIQARKDNDLYCGACRALVDELSWAVEQVDPKKTIQVGSFRINPDGSQTIAEVPYARSETHLLELMDHVCENMADYGQTEQGPGGRKSFVRLSGRVGEKLDLVNVTISSETTKMLKFACESIVEEYEDDVIALFVHGAENVTDKFCSSKTDFCDEAVHTTHDEL
uniref:protein canopy homolog 2-like isoform X1 n=1 Tax=Myxine glutinosa TaxID=7769 RepID=UPI00358E2EBE